MKISTINIIGRGNVAFHYHKIMKEKGYEVRIIPSRKEFVLDEFMKKRTSELTGLYLSIHKICIKHKLDLVMKLLDYLEGMYSKPIILVKLYNLYEYDRWEDTDDDFIDETFKIVKEEHYTDIHKFGHLAPRSYNEFAYYHEFIDEIAGSVFSSTYFNVVKCDVVIAAFRQIAKFIFNYPLSEFKEEEGK